MTRQWCQRVYFSSLKMFSQTVSNWSCLLILLPMFLEDCKRLLPDGAADAVICMGLSCSRCTCRSRELSTNDRENKSLDLTPTLNPLQIFIWGAFLKVSSETNNNFWIKRLRSHWISYRKLCRKKSCPESGRESTRKLVEDILSICCNSKVFTLKYETIFL